MNPNIKISTSKRSHSKASEQYITVQFLYPRNDKKESCTFDIPIEYRRTGIKLQNNEEIEKYLESIYDILNPNQYQTWKKQETIFWNTLKADVTKSFFLKLLSFQWECVKHSLPTNPNWARRIQDIKEMGYTLATNTKKWCPICKQNTTHIQLIPLPRYSNNRNGYETWTPKLRKKILAIFHNIDSYENSSNTHSLPDHKFPEIRWGQDTKEKNPKNMTEKDIKEKFQLLSNQRNQQKREVCRNCYQTGQRGYLFGIPFYYQGTSNWNPKIPRSGKEAQKGCIGCGWYDIQKWRTELLKKLGIKS